MTFLEQCIQDSMPIWQDCLESEFVQGVAHGTLPEECFKGYIVDDSLYLREYSKVFAWGILHSHDMEEIRNYYSLLSFVNESEDATRRYYLKRYHLTDEATPAPPPPAGKSCLRGLHAHCRPGWSGGRRVHDGLLALHAQLRLDFWRGHPPLSPGGIHSLLAFCPGLCRQPL